MTTFPLRILSPAQTLFSGDVTTITATSLDGRLQVLAHHAPASIALIPAILRVDTGGATQWYAHSSASLHIFPNGGALLLASHIQPAPSEAEAQTLLADIHKLLAPLLSPDKT